MEPIMDGEIILEELLKSTKDYGSLENAIAKLSLFTNPQTLKSLKHSNILKIIRASQPEVRGGKYKDHMADDNMCVKLLFTWINGISLGQFDHCQFNHIYRGSDKKDKLKKYTCLSNIVVTPSFLAKLTDKTQKIIDLLKYRVFDIYGYDPDNISPERPDIYDKLEWRPYLPPQDNIESHLELRLKKNALSNAIQSVKHFGWYFNGFEAISDIKSKKKKN